mmetsp:Transcript_8309/g.20797  ORF Transcript_8309/g.20797 Transcript_8309/m.20797 type:complete len:211 (-) Transcript_8309:639-1271(-)
MMKKTRKIIVSRSSAASTTSKAKTDQPITVRLLCVLLLGVFIGKNLPSDTLTDSRTTTRNANPTGSLLRASSTTATQLDHTTAPDAARTTEEKDGDDTEKNKRPLFVFPLLKELRSGWSNMQLPPLLQRNATGTGALIVDIGLDAGVEFFTAIETALKLSGSRRILAHLRRWQNGVLLFPRRARISVRSYVTFRRSKTACHCNVHPARRI